ncbi:hypothetical protein [Lysobacter silvisoli]|uniref:Uncharacterized protein n=1 Tax=Lysobacter silvisoli TaxID=2293254 RepID=A0A371K314_9GAMM|nr:hypothetical protein [Lysobacter silvisoli]RDZ28272.1 hypothetical protein DX914_03760 [Lysobacter silvisoli]
MSKWNRAFSDLIRRSRPAYWGNWALNAQIRPGAVGIVDPESGDFQLVREQLPNLQVLKSATSSSWQLMTERVQRTEAKVDVSGEVTDPESGVKGEAGLEVNWSMSHSGSIASEFSLREEAFLQDLTVLQNHTEWLAQQAQSVGFGNHGLIAQGFGVVTSVIYANSGLNVGSQSDDSSFAIAGRASAIQEMLGGASGKGSFTSVRKAKSVDRHLWPDQANTQPSGLVPIAYAFASFDGHLLMPNWIGKLGSFQIFFNNKVGSTYIVDIVLSYNTPEGPRREAFSISGGLSRTIGNIPLNATDISVEAKFRGVINSDTYRRHWARPLGQWLTGQRHIELFGVWPGATHFTVLEE